MKARPQPTFETIAQLPRGGPNAGWLDRQLETRRLEYTDRQDVPDRVKQRVIDVLEWMGEREGLNERMAAAVLSLTSAVAAPRILELGAGHGKLSAAILAASPAAEVTATDRDPVSVRRIADTLAPDPRAHTMVADATSIGARDDSFDAVVFANSFHHLPPRAACLAIREATRVAPVFAVIDIPRFPTPVLLAHPLLAVPMGVAVAVKQGPAAVWPFLHDATITALRCYSRPALEALGVAANPALSTTITRLAGGARPGPPAPNLVVYRRR